MKSTHPLSLLLRPTGGLLGDMARLAGINLAIAAFSAASFVAGVQLVAWFNRATGRLGAEELPFPYPVPPLLAAVLFLLAWTWFARSLPAAGLRPRLAVAAVGASPLLGLGLCGYLLLALLFLLSGGMADSETPAASFHLLGLAATLALASGLACVLAVAFLGRRAQPSA